MGLGAGCASERVPPRRPGRRRKGLPRQSAGGTLRRAVPPATGRDGVHHGPGVSVEESMLSSPVPTVPAYPARRPELIVRPLGEQGRYVVKDPHKSTYYQLGDEEYFLLTQLDGCKAP